MRTIIDLGSELLVDTSGVRDPYVRLLLAAVGQELAVGSPWLALDKGVAAASGLDWETAAVGAKCLGLSGDMRDVPRRSVATALGHDRRASARAAQWAGR